MKRLALAGVALAALLSPAFADDFTSGSHIDAVTVFPRGAEVTREVIFALPAGENRLIVNDLPGQIDASSVRVEASSAAGLTIGSVDVRSEAVKSNESETRRNEIEANIAALEAENRKLDRRIDDQNFQKDFLEALGRGAIEPRRATVSPSAQRADAASRSRREPSFRHDRCGDGGAEPAGKDRQGAGGIAARGAALPGQPVYRSLVTIALRADAAGEASFTLRYGIANAGWRPVYDARLDTGTSDRAPGLDLVSRAEVSQRSGEPWANVALTLSTARITGATQAPVLPPEPLSPRPPMAERQAGSVMRQAVPTAPMLNELAKAKDMAREAEAQVETAGFEALYKIAGRQSIGNAGEAKGVRIASLTMPPAWKRLRCPGSTRAPI